MRNMRCAEVRLISTPSPPLPSPCCCWASQRKSLAHMCHADALPIPSVVMHGHWSSSISFSFAGCHPTPPRSLPPSHSSMLDRRRNRAANLAPAPLLWGSITRTCRPKSILSFALPCPLVASCRLATIFISTPRHNSHTTTTVLKGGRCMPLSLDIISKQFSARELLLA